MDVINAFIEHVLNNFLAVIAWIIQLLPSSPIPSESLFDSGFGRSIGYFIPIDTMLLHFSLMLVGLLVWYSAEYIMRWVKMIK